jgi:transcription initiation factor TFIIB
MAGCPVCGGRLITDLQRGEVVCARCGLVVAEAVVDTGPEWRVFDEREKRRVRAAPLKLVIKTDMDVKPERGERWRRLAKFHRESLHGRERRLVEIGAELKRVRECVGLLQSVVEEAESLVKKYFDLVAGFPPEVVAVLWTAAKAAGVPRPLEDLLRCSKAEERRVRKAAWRLKEAIRQSKRPSIEDYVKTLAARVNLPASVVKAAVEPGTTPTSIRNAANRLRV